MESGFISAEQTATNLSNTLHGDELHEIRMPLLRDTALNSLMWMSFYSAVKSGWFRIDIQLVNCAPPSLEHSSRFQGSNKGLYMNGVKLVLHFMVDFQERERKRVWEEELQFTHCCSFQFLIMEFLRRGWQTKLRQAVVERYLWLGLEGESANGGGCNVIN